VLIKRKEIEQRFWIKISKFHCSFERKNGKEVSYFWDKKKSP